jgi:chromosome segregation ATPase
MDDLSETLAARQDELDQLRRELARLERLETELKVRSRWDEDLRLTAENLDARLLRRDEELAARERELAAREAEIAELRRIQEGLLQEVEWRRGNEESLRETERRLGKDIDALQGRIAAIEETRLWRLGQRYWGFRDGVRNALRRSAR